MVIFPGYSEIWEIKQALDSQMFVSLILFFKTFGLSMHFCAENSKQRQQNTYLPDLHTGVKAVKTTPIYRSPLQTEHPKVLQ